MSYIRIFFPESLSLNLKSQLDKSQSHYLTKVMRIKIGENFSLFNKNGEWLAQIDQINKGRVEFCILEQLKKKQNFQEFWLAFSPIKSNYLNFMIQKSTELGITKFLPIIFDRTIVRNINYERFTKIIIEASEQSNRINVPSLEKKQNLNNFLKEYQKKINLIFTDLNSNVKKIEIDKSDKKPLCIIIGPEGDFSEEERKAILNFGGVKSMRINENILRSETAAISAISILNYITSL